jgi:3-oxoacyl-[acyl-carrier-protein] synthase-3
MSALGDLEKRLLHLVGNVREALGMERECGGASARFADVLDSMGLVELIAVIAEDLDVAPETIEAVAERRFGTIAELAAALAAAGLHNRRAARDLAPSRQAKQVVLPPAYLAGTVVRLPTSRQTTEELDAAIGRPAGWLTAHAGITTRAVWRLESPLDAAVSAALECLQKVAHPAADVTTLIVVSEAPPQPVGLAAALHHRLGLGPHCPALEMGGACTGLLSALWCARRLLAGGEAILLVTVEAPSQWLSLRPGPQGEAAALFGDAAAACLLTTSAIGDRPLSLINVAVATDGQSADVLRVNHAPDGGLEVEMDGPALAQRAVSAMAEGVRDMVLRHGSELSDVDAIVMHGGNGRMPPLLARQLGLSVDRVFSSTPTTGNLGTASLLAGWALCGPLFPSARRVVWTAAGAGLQWGAALWEHSQSQVF